eukprot:366528-Chlamydomonas_euryale.AAC.8
MHAICACASSHRKSARCSRRSTRSSTFWRILTTATKRLAWHTTLPRWAVAGRLRIHPRREVLQVG